MGTVVQFFHNDTEKSFSYKIGDVTRNLSILASAGEDPQHLSISDYSEAQDEPVNKVKLYDEEIQLLKALLSLM
jgi:hypothetical protein